MRSVKQAFDFHCHSTSSDGTLTAIEMFNLAVESGLESWSLTDHDTMAGYHEVVTDMQCRRKIENASLQVIPGIELSVNWKGLTIHIVALGFDPNAKDMQGLINKQLFRRTQRAVKIGQQIEDKLNLPEAYHKACLLSGDELPGRPHFANLLIDNGIVSNFSDAFSRYLGAGKWGDVKLYWPDLDEVTEAVVMSGGVAVIAHPFHYKMTASKLRKLLDDFGHAGGQGAELCVPNISHGHFGWMVEELHRRKMIQSGGSDFHGSLTPWCRLGYFPSISSKIPNITDRVSVRISR